MNPAPPAPRPHPELDRETVEALRAVRDRLLQLRESYYFFMQAVHPDSPTPISWPDLLGKFNVLVAKHSHLRTEMLRYRTLLSGLALHPCEPPVNEAEAGSLPVLLRTKLLPAMERDELAARQEANAEEPNAEIRMQMLEQLRLQAAEIVEQLRGEIDLRLRMDPLEVDRPAEQPAEASTVSGENRTVAAADKLEKILSWMSSGPIRVMRKISPDEMHVLDRAFYSLHVNLLVTTATCYVLSSSLCAAISDMVYAKQRTAIGLLRILQAAFGLGAVLTGFTLHAAVHCPSVFLASTITLYLSSLCATLILLSKACLANSERYRIILAVSALLEVPSAGALVWSSYVNNFDRHVGFLCQPLVLYLLPYIIKGIATMLQNAFLSYLMLRPLCKQAHFVQSSECAAIIRGAFIYLIVTTLSSMTYSLTAALDGTRNGIIPVWLHLTDATVTSMLLREQFRSQYIESFFYAD
ncbi:hypothetical protein THASP1DRAFT_27297 [Thamnocephalis sphaerospora]|uniref:Mediator of RNA polymerase II transcription subunit 8 n=1 Tax=Thamnocephalis sphaerospora TaxID=78915 RepID=A0A4P9XXY2_9FUNG|nr:hypothetical protein THASP1DRAFT_27297 [Thamnocephalis sphaerospora]|eukprot:RKP10932.1 hypothetical protein THASP1DRAFT_27297 [Thamnocephalis sphaerospora]